ncbi:MAG: hypothetical protein ACN4GM_02280 [Gammaproteobacteria bacterium]
MRLKTVLAFMAGLAVVGSAVADRSEFEKWLSQETTSFQEYRDKRDKEFTSFLKTQWKEMETFSGLVRDKTPKPVRMPVALPLPAPKPTPMVQPLPDSKPTPMVQPKPDTKPETPKPLPLPDSKPLPSPVPTPLDQPAQDEKPLVATPKPVVKPPTVKVPPIAPPPKPVIVKPIPAVKLPKGQTIRINYYGQSLRFTYDAKLKVGMYSRIDATAMSRHWSSLSQGDYEALLKQINHQRQPLSLNDWGYALLINEIAREIYPGQSNEQALFGWFMLIKAGYQARIAYDSSRVYLLLPSRQQLFGASYFTFDNVRYYALGFDGSKQKPGRVYTYDGQYPGATKRMDMRLDKTLNTGRKESGKQLSFKYQGKTYKVNIGYDQQTVRFLKTYPQMDIGMYFTSSVNQSTGNPLLAQLKPMVEGKSEQDAVNLLLRFVQTAFRYKTDQAQFGTENYLFPEETLYYPYSDCEDRSVFFAWLVRSLLNLDVVGLDFPGHIATAVRFNESVSGDAVRYKGKRYVVSDPTYINARAGMTMPEFRSKRPNVIPIVF